MTMIVNNGLGQRMTPKRLMQSILLPGLLVISSATFVFGVASAGAEDSATPPPSDKPADAKAKEEPIATGVIANSGSVPTGSAVDVNTQGATPGDEASVIQGSVSQASRGKCSATVTNGSEENTYSVRYRVVGTDERGNSALKKSFSAVLKPSQSQTREVSCKPEYRMQIVLLSATKR